MITIPFVKMLGFPTLENYCQFVRNWVATQLKPSFPRRGGPDPRHQDHVRGMWGICSKAGTAIPRPFSVLVHFVHLLAKPIPPVFKEGGWRICELELFACQSAITTPPSDELSANESEPDGQIFLKTTCLKSGGGEEILAKLSRLCVYIRCTALCPSFCYSHHYHLEKTTRQSSRGSRAVGDRHWVYSHNRQGCL